MDAGKPPSHRIPVLSSAAVNARPSEGPVAIASPVKRQSEASEGGVYPKPRTLHYSNFHGYGGSSFGGNSVNAQSETYAGELSNSLFGPQQSSTWTPPGNRQHNLLSGPPPRPQVPVPVDQSHPQQYIVANAAPVWGHNPQSQGMPWASASSATAPMASIAVQDQHQASMAAASPPPRPQVYSSRLHGHPKPQAQPHWGQQGQHGQLSSGPPQLPQQVAASIQHQHGLTAPPPQQQNFDSRHVSPDVIRHAMAHAMGSGSAPLLHQHGSTLQGVPPAQQSAVMRGVGSSGGPVTDWTPTPEALTRQGRQQVHQHPQQQAVYQQQPTYQQQQAQRQHGPPQQWQGQQHQQHSDHQQHNQQHRLHPVALFAPLSNPPSPSPRPLPPLPPLPPIAQPPIAQPPTAQPPTAQPPVHLLQPSPEHGLQHPITWMPPHLRPGHDGQHADLSTPGRAIPTNHGLPQQAGMAVLEGMAQQTSRATGMQRAATPPVSGQLQGSSLASHGFAAINILPCSGMAAQPHTAPAAVGSWDSGCVGQGGPTGQSAAASLVTASFATANSAIAHGAIGGLESMRARYEQTAYMKLEYPIRYMLFSSGVMQMVTDRAHALAQHTHIAVSHAACTSCVDGCACVWDHPALQGMVRARTEAELLTALAALYRDGSVASASAGGAGVIAPTLCGVNAKLFRTGMVRGEQEQAALHCWDKLKESGCIVVDTCTGRFRWRTDAAQCPPYTFMSASLCLKYVPSAAQMSRQDDASKGACAHAGSMQAAGLTGLVLPVELHPTMLCSRDGSWALRHPVLNSHNRLLAVHLGDDDWMDRVPLSKIAKQRADIANQLAALLISGLSLVGRQFNFLGKKSKCYWFYAHDSLAPSDTFVRLDSAKHARALLGAMDMLPTVPGMVVRDELLFSKTAPVTLKDVHIMIVPDLVDYDAKGRMHILTDGCGRASPDLWPLIKYAFDAHAAGRDAADGDSMLRTTAGGPLPPLNLCALNALQATPVAAAGTGASSSCAAETSRGSSYASGNGSGSRQGSCTGVPPAGSGAMQYQQQGGGLNDVGTAKPRTAASGSVGSGNTGALDAAGQVNARGSNEQPSYELPAAACGQLAPIQLRMHIPLCPAAANEALAQAGETDATFPWPVLAMCKGTLSPDWSLPARTIVVTHSMVKAPLVPDAAKASPNAPCAVGGHPRVAGNTGAASSGTGPANGNAAGSMHDLAGSTQPVLGAMGTWTYIQSASAERCPLVYIEVVKLATPISRNSVQYLNTTLVALLADGGVKREYFYDLVRSKAKEIAEGIATPQAAGDLAKAYKFESLEQRICAGYGQELPAYEGAVRQWATDGPDRPDHQMLSELHNLQVCQLKNLYKLHLPMASSYMAMGQPDVTQSLLERQVVLLDSSGQSLYEAPTPALLYRHPGLHPADIVHVTVVPPTEAISRRYGVTYCGVLLMSTQGGESLAALSSGGDYDGDMFVLMTDPRVVLSYQPYTASTCLDGPEEPTPAAAGRLLNNAAASSRASPTRSGSTSGRGFGAYANCVQTSGISVAGGAVRQVASWRAAPSHIHDELLKQKAQFYVHGQACFKRMSQVPRLWNKWAEEKGPRSTQCILASHNYNALLDAKKCGADPQIDPSIGAPNLASPCWALELSAAGTATKDMGQATMQSRQQEGSTEQPSVMTTLCTVIQSMLPAEPSIADNPTCAFAPDWQVLKWAKQQLAADEHWQWLNNPNREQRHPSTPGAGKMTRGSSTAEGMWETLLAFVADVHTKCWSRPWMAKFGRDDGEKKGANATKEAQKVRLERDEGFAQYLYADVNCKLLELAGYGGHGSAVHEPLNCRRFGVVAAAYYCAVYQRTAQQVNSDGLSDAKAGSRLRCLWRGVGDVLCQLKAQLVAEACCPPGAPFRLPPLCAQAMLSYGRKASSSAWVQQPAEAHTMEEEAETLKA